MVYMFYVTISMLPFPFVVFASFNFGFVHQLQTAENTIFLIMETIFHSGLESLYTSLFFSPKLKLGKLLINLQPGNGFWISSFYIYCTYLSLKTLLFVSNRLWHCIQSKQLLTNFQWHLQENKGAFTIDISLLIGHSWIAGTFTSLAFATMKHTLND